MSNDPLTGAASEVPRRRQPRRRLAKGILLSASLAMSLLIVEAGLRLTGLDSPLVWKPDSEVGWHHIPGARMRWTEEGDGRVEINALGYRDRPRTEAKPPGVFRVVLLGDSMTEGVQVNFEETFAYR